MFVNMTESNPQLAYIGPRNDILELIPNNISKILDVGCSIGVLGKQIKQKNYAEVTGIEIDPNMAFVLVQHLQQFLEWYFL